MTEQEFCRQVDELAEKHYDVIDGGDLCYNLIRVGVVIQSEGAGVAARIVAQHIIQA